MGLIQASGKKQTVTGISAINGITKSGVSAVNGLTI